MKDPLARARARGHAAVRLHPDLLVGVDYDTAAADIVADILLAVAERDGDPEDVHARAWRTYRGDLFDASKAGAS